MSRLDMTPKLRGDFGELTFKHFCEKNKYAHVSLENIYNKLKPDNKITFECGYHRIPVKIPDNIIEEIRTICKPSNEKEYEPSFVFDFLTVSLNVSFDYIKGRYIQKPYLTHKAFNWIEIKTDNSELTRNQRNLKGKTQIPLRIFRVPIRDFMPKEIEVFEEVHK